MQFNGKCSGSYEFPGIKNKIAAGICCLIFGIQENDTKIVLFFQNLSVSSSKYILKNENMEYSMKYRN